MKRVMLLASLCTAVLLAGCQTTTTNQLNYCAAATNSYNALEVAYAAAMAAGAKPVVIADLLKAAGVAQVAMLAICNDQPVPTQPATNVPTP